MISKFIFFILISSSVTYAIKHPESFGNQYNLNKKTHSSNLESFDYKPQYAAKLEKFQLEKKGHNWAILSWDAPSSSHNNHSHHIYRNKVLIAKLNAQQFVFKDKFLEPEKKYHYEIHASNIEGWNSPKSSLTLTTLENLPPVILIKKTTIYTSHLNEIGTLIHKFSAWDKNKDKLYYKLKGKNASSFMINQNTGELINKIYLLDQRNYNISVQVSDGIEKSSVDIIIST